jgi:hypothetical protein
MLDESYGRFLIANDGYGTCTGTSMAAPFITSAAALIRSIYPRATIDETRLILRASGSLASAPSVALGSGTVNVLMAVNKTVSTYNPRRLTPLYAYYSPYRLDSFYTTKPQLAVAAVVGTMLPRVPGSTNPLNNRYIDTYGNPTSGPQLPPTDYAVFGPAPNMSKAEAWIFTTIKNPLTGGSLEPLFNMSWRCGDTSFYTPACTTNPSHVDTVLVGYSETAYFNSMGYRSIGVEGYIYPPNQAQPAGTVALLRRYNPNRDDHAVFPATALSTMAAMGYTATTGNDVIGYVYANPASGAMPSY